MSITLPRHLEQQVQDKVRSGAYHSSEEVLEESLRLLARRDAQQEQLRRDIQVGVDQAERGELVAGEAVFANLRAKYVRKS